MFLVEEVLPLERTPPETLAWVRPVVLLLPEVAMAGMPEQAPMETENPARSPVVAGAGAIAKQVVIVTEGMVRTEW